MYVSDFEDRPGIRRAIKEYGFQVECTEFIWRERTISDEEMIAKAREEFGTVGSLHGPFWDLDFASKDPVIVQATYEAYDKFHKIAEAIGANRIVVHNMCDLEDNPRGLRESVDFWKDYLAEHKGILYCIENIIDPSPHFLRELYDQVDLENFTICLDVGHANITAEDGVVSWVKALGHRIGHVHLHNNYGETDEHNGLTDGTIDMNALLTELMKTTPTSEWNIENYYINDALDWLAERNFL